MLYMVPNDLKERMEMTKETEENKDNIILLFEKLTDWVNFAQFIYACFSDTFLVNPDKNVW